MAKFTHLHVHSHYSLLDGLSKIPELLDYVKELGMDSVALTDHGVLYGAIEFYKEAIKRDIKPIIGCEIYVAFENMEQKRPHLDNKRYHLVLLAKNETGYKNLARLITKAHLEGFYYKPRVDEKLLAKHADGLIALSACLAGKIPRLIIAKRYSEAEETALRYQKIFGPGNFYLELQHHPHIKEQAIVNQTIITIARKYGIPLVATNDSHYLRPEDAQAQDILMLINTGANPNDPERLTLIADDFSVKSPETMIKDFKNTPEAIENTQKIKEMCNFQFKLGKTILPKFELPKGKSSYSQYLKELCFQGLPSRYPSPPSQQVKERLKKELAIIDKTGFSSYFLIVQDFVRWAKENKIVVGPGRGSVAGSIVAYLLGITEIDPLKYDLLFERFLNGKRISAPDIDLDFADTRRDEVIRYVTEKYGQKRVAQIITFGTMAARAVIRDVGRALNYSYGYCDRIAKMIPMGASLDKALESVSDFRQLYFEDERAKTLVNLAKRLEGVARHASTHACGVVISKEPLDNIVPLQRPTQDEKAIVTQYDMHGIEDLGLLKMDFLGLKNLTIIEEALNLIKKDHGLEIDIHSLPENDEKTFALLQKAQTTSVFQLESQGMKRYLRMLKPNEFEDIIAMVALYRPGPMNLIPQYIKRKQGKEKIDYPHPKLEPILKSTYGICVFQEQLMQMAREIAGFNAAEADTLRKAVGKKIKSLLDQQKDKFIKGAIDNKVGEATANKLWQWILPFARYGFNKAHAASYATIAYQTAYLKAHWPVEFMTAALHSEKAEVERIAFLISECKQMGIDVLPPDINQSEESFSVTGQSQIRFGLEAIKNVGQNIVKAIVSEREKNGAFASIVDFSKRLASENLNKKSLESLIKAGTFDQLNERNRLLANMDNLLNWAREERRQKLNGQKSLFQKNDLHSKIKLKPAPAASKKEKLSWEKELLGLFVTSHPIDDFKEVVSKKAFPIAKIVGELFGLGKRVRVGGVISNIKRIITRNGKPMLFVTIEDRTDKMEVVAFPSIIERKPSLFQENKVVFVSGQVDNKDGVCKLICEDIEEIVEKS
jgi:DNA polymerase-3 subunit alpha